MAAGWDIPSHFYLVTRMFELMRQEAIQGYDTLWYGGYPLFLLYSPLYYIFAALPAFLLNDRALLEVGFSSLNFLLPFFLLVSLQLFARISFGREYGWCALSFGILMLCLPGRFAHSALGLNAQFQIGFLPNFFALPFFVLFLAMIIRCRQSDSLKFAVCGVLLLTLIILSHQLTALFAFFALAMALLLCRGGYRIRCVGIGTSSLLLSSWWWLPSLGALNVGSGQIEASAVDFADPLLILFPNLFDSNVIAQCLTYLRRSWAEMEPVSAATWFGLLKSVPLSGFLLLLFGGVGIVAHLRRGDWLLPTILVAGTIVLPRYFLAQLLDLPIHYYRFTQHLFIVNLLLASYGFGLVVNSASSAVARNVSATLMSVALVLGPLVQCDLKVSAPFRDSRSTRFYPSLAQYRYSNEAMKMAAHVASLKPRGRVLDESPASNWLRLGTPHYFSSVLPLKYGVAVANGLLVESSPLARLINPIMYAASEHLRWGDQTLWKEAKFRADTFSNQLKRLRLFSVQFIIATSRRLKARLKRSSEVNKRARFGPFVLYELVDTTKQSCRARMPYLFVNKGMSFRKMNELWIRNSALFCSPIAWYQGNFEDIAVESKVQFAGLILGWNRRVPFSEVDFAKWTGRAKKVLVLDGYPDHVVPLDKNIQFLPQFGEDADLKELATILAEAPKLDSEILAIPVSEPMPRVITVYGSGPRIVQIANVPGWRQDDVTRPLYTLTPGFIYLPSGAVTTIRYDPWGNLW